jgi:hypothetical protein
MFDMNPVRFREVLGADPDVLGPYWTAMLRDDSFAAHVRAHPVLRGFSPERWRQCIPVTLHEDAGPYLNSGSCNVVSWGSLFGSGGDKVSEFILASYVKDKNAHPTEAELANMWNPIFADFDRLLTIGIGGFCFLPVYAKGDLECRANSWGLAHYNSEEVCTECRANRAAASFTDLGSEAAWRRTLVGSAADFRARARTPLHPLLACSFFWRGFFPLDLMHVADCKGTIAIVAGSVIRPLVLGRADIGRTQEERLRVVNDRLRAFYTARPGYTRMAPLRLNNLVSLGWSCLSGVTVKAANTRALVPFLVELATEYYSDPNDEYARLVLRTVRALARMNEICYTAGFFLLPC